MIAPVALLKQPQINAAVNDVVRELLPSVRSIRYNYASLRRRQTEPRIGVEHARELSCRQLRAPLLEPLLVSKVQPHIPVLFPRQNRAECLREIPFHAHQLRAGVRHA